MKDLCLRVLHLPITLLQGHLQEPPPSQEKQSIHSVRLTHPDILSTLPMDLSTDRLQGLPPQHAFRPYPQGSCHRHPPFLICVQYHR